MAVRAVSLLPLPLPAAFGPPIACPLPFQYGVCQAPMCAWSWMLCPVVNCSCSIPAVWALCPQHQDPLVRSLARAVLQISPQQSSFLLPHWQGFLHFLEAGLRPHTSAREPRSSVVAPSVAHTYPAPSSTSCPLWDPTVLFVPEVMCGPLPLIFPTVLILLILLVENT